MKKLLFILVVVIISLGCKDKPMRECIELSVNENSYPYIYWANDSILGKDAISNFNQQDKIESLTLINVSIMDRYVKECYNDSIYFEYWQQPDYSKYQKTDKHGITTQLAIYIEPTLIKEWKHKEPTFIGFYEWLKTNINK